MTNTCTPKTALITGITGQDGSYLAEFLLEKGYTVHGIKHRASSFNTARVDHIYQDPHVDNARFKLHYGDLIDSSNLTRIIQETQPDEIYNLGAQSHVAVSFESPEYTADVDGMGTLRTLRILEAICILGFEKPPASTKPVPANSTAWCKKPCSAKPPRLTHAAPTPWPSSTPTGSRSITAKPTACMPATASCSTTKARAGVKPSSPEKSPRPGQHQPGAGRLPLHGQHRRPAGLGPRQRLCAHAMDDAATRPGGRFCDRHRCAQYSVHQFIEWTATELGMPLRWEGAGVDEVGYWNNKPIVKIDPRYFRPTEVETPLGDPRKAKQKLGWVPEITAQEMCTEMVAHDLAQAKQHALLKANGYQVNVSVE